MKEYSREILARYQLTEDEFETMYKKAELLTFSNISPEKCKPFAIMLGGQPGAGKTGLVLKTKKEFEKAGKDLIVFDLDSYRGLYKDAIEIAREYPELYSEITGKASGKVMERLSDKAIREGYNFVMEGTMGKSAYTIDVLLDMKVDYNIIARVMAVSNVESLLSIFERYIEMKKTMGIGRITTVESHNLKYDNFPKVVSTLEKRNIPVEVYERSDSLDDISKPKMIYQTGNSANIYQSVNCAILAGRRNSVRKSLRTAKFRLEIIKKEILQFEKERDGILLQYEELEKIIDNELLNEKSTPEI